MNSLKLPFKRETFMPMLAMTFASAVCVAVVLLRIAWTGKIRYGFLAWNLLLAWLPLLFALLALFATFIFIAYLMLSALTHLPTAAQMRTDAYDEAESPTSA